MTLLHLIVLSVVQGITEFLPVSSSAHLVLVPFFMGEPDQGLVIDLASHVGTLAAVLFYCRAEIARMILGAIETLKTRRLTPSNLALQIVLATVPAVVAGFLLHDFKPEGIRNIEIMGWNLIIFGLLLGLADRMGKMDFTIDRDMTYKRALIVGLAQMLALIPGTSRSGITMTAGRFLGFSRIEAARFSLLVGIPATFGACVIGGLDLYKSNDPAKLMDAGVVAFLSFLTALVAISLMMKWLKGRSFTPFVIYRVILGAGLLCYVYGLLS